MDRRERGAVSPMLAAVAAGLVGGATLGFAVQDWGVLDLVDEPPAVELRSDRIAALDCPDGTPVASLARGDRVLVVGRDPGRDWVEIRSPVDLADGAWIRAGVLAGDLAATDLALLPVSDCDRAPAPTTTAPPETTTSSSTTSSTTTTTSTTTTLPATTSTVTTLPTTSTTADTGPVISSFTIAAVIDEEGTLRFGYVHEAPDPLTPLACPSDTQVRVSASDPDGIASVTFQWTTGADGAVGTVPLALDEDGTFVGTFVFDEASVPTDEPFREPTFVFTATDRRGVATTVVVEPPTQAFRVYDTSQDCEQVLPPDD